MALPGQGACLSLAGTHSRGEQVPAVLLTPDDWKRSVAVWVDPEGKRAAFDEDGAPRAGVARLLDSGVAVLAIDLFGQGEFTEDGQPIEDALVGPER